MEHGLALAAVYAHGAHEKDLYRHAVGHGGYRAALVLRGQFEDDLSHPLLDLPKALAAGYEPPLRLVVEEVHLLGPPVGDVAPGLALPDAHVYLAQARRRDELELPPAQERTRRCNGPVQVAGIHRVYLYPAETFRQGVYLPPAPVRDLAVPVALSTAEEVPLRLCVTYEIYTCHMRFIVQSRCVLTIGLE